MNRKELAFSLKRRLESLPYKYKTSNEQMLYEQGILLGLLITLMEYDSKNYEIVIRQLKKLESHE